MKYKHNLIYLASPYSHPSDKVKDRRAKQVSKVAARLMKHGYNIYCPIAETVMVAQAGNIKNTDWEFWKDQDIPKLERCDELWVVGLKGWENSVGVAAEMQFAKLAHIPISFLNPKNLMLTRRAAYKDSIYGRYKQMLFRCRLFIIKMKVVLKRFILSFHNPSAG